MCGLSKIIANIIEAKLHFKPVKATTQINNFYNLNNFATKNNIDYITWRMITPYPNQAIIGV